MWAVMPEANIEGYKMDKYISVKVAKEYLRHDSFSNPYFRSQACQQAIDVLDTVPTSDVVEVVRCRECIYWRGENDLCKGICIDFDADGYCSKGKRKDGGQDG